ncbi:hypothetical protein MRX96_007593 [Rhipicephalus microplus]
MPVLHACQERHVLLQAVCSCPTILTTGLRQGRAMQGVGSTPVFPGPKPEPSGTACIATGLLSVRCANKSAQAPPQLNMLRKKRHKESYSTIGIIFFSVPSVVWTKWGAQSGCNTGKQALTIPVSHGTVPDITIGVGTLPSSWFCTQTRVDRVEAVNMFHRNWSVS